MKINFSDAVKLASKGFKPKDIEAIKELDENKFNKDDILSLVGNGYSAADLKKLCDTFAGSSDDPEDETDDKDANEDNKDKSGKGSDDQGDHTDDSDDQEDDNIDYKELYEKEKKLREKLQHDNAAGTEGPEDSKEDDFDIAVRIAQEL